MVAKIVTAEQARAKTVLNELLVDLKLPSNGPSAFDDWLQFVSSFIRKELAAAKVENMSHNSLNHHHPSSGAGDDSNSESSGDTTTTTNKSGSSTNSPATSNNLNGSSTGEVVVAATGVGNSEVLLLQNAQLQKSLDEYKNIVADTVSSFLLPNQEMTAFTHTNSYLQEQMLRNLEAKVAERDTYWQGVVQSKDEEIIDLKSSAQS